jgi:hypothetical protein
MFISIAELDVLLNDLQGRLPQMVEDYPEEGDFWMAFAGAAESIEYKADEHTYEYVMQRIQAMLAEHERYIAIDELEEA